MRNIVPLHRSKPLAICVVQHLEYQRNWRRLIRISYLGWVKFYFFPLLAKYSQRARPKRNAYFIHKTISVREKIAQIHTNTQRSYCDVMPLLRMVRNCTTVEWYAASQRLSSHRRVHNKLSRCCTIRIVDEYESLWDNLGMSDIIYSYHSFLSEYLCNIKTIYTSHSISLPCMWIKKRLKVPWHAHESWLLLMCMGLNITKSLFVWSRNVSYIYYNFSKHFLSHC